MDCLRALVVPGECPGQRRLGFDSPKVVCYVPFKIGHASGDSLADPAGRWLLRAARDAGSDHRTIGWLVHDDGWVLRHVIRTAVRFHSLHVMTRSRRWSLRWAGPCSRPDKEPAGGRQVPLHGHQHVDDLPELVDHCDKLYPHADVRVCRCEVGPNGTQLGGKPVRWGAAQSSVRLRMRVEAREVSASSPTVVTCRFYAPTRGPVRSLATSGRAAPIGRRSLRRASCRSEIGCGTTCQICCGRCSRCPSSGLQKPSDSFAGRRLSRKTFQGRLSHASSPSALMADLPALTGSLPKFRTRGPWSRSGLRNVDCSRNPSRASWLPTRFARLSGL